MNIRVILLFLLFASLNSVIATQSISCSDFPDDEQCIDRGDSAPQVERENFQMDEVEESIVDAVEDGFFEDESYSHVQIIPENVKNCLQIPNECPQFASGQLEEDYPFRFSRRQKTGCYFEFQDFSTSCFDACEHLFFTSSKHARFGFKVSQACKVGCNYAKYAKSAKKDTCMYTCKNTAWKQQINDQSCNWRKGLNLEIDEIPDFEISKACEFGCILGNERPCPVCEDRSHTKNVFFDV